MNQIQFATGHSFRVFKMVDGVMVIVGTASLSHGDLTANKPVLRGADSVRYVKIAYSLGSSSSIISTYKLKAGLVLLAISISLIILGFGKSNAEHSAIRFLESGVVFPFFRMVFLSGVRFLFLDGSCFVVRRIPVLLWHVCCVGECEGPDSSTNGLIFRMFQTVFNPVMAYVPFPL